MKTGKRILKNLASLSVAELAKNGIALVTTIYLARVISPEGFGIIGFSTSIIAYFVLVVNFGFDVVGSREIAKFPDRLNQYVNSVSTIRLFLSVASYIALTIVALAINKPDTVKYVLLIQGFNIFSNGMLLNWVFIGLEKMEVIAVRQVSVALLNLIGLLIFVHGYGDTIVAVVVMASSLALNTAWMLFYYIKNFGGIKARIDIPLWKELFKAAIPIGMSFFIVVIYNNLNMTMLGAMRTEGETGIYFAAYKILIFAIVPSQIIQSTFFPNLSRQEHLEDRDRYMKKFTLLTYLSGSFVSFSFIVFAEHIVNILGDEYSESTGVLRIIMLTGFLMYSTITYSCPLNAWKKERQVMYSIAAGGVVNIVVNFLLIPKYGVYGAAVATLISELVVLSGLGWYMFKTQNKLYLKEMIKYTAISAAAVASAYLLLILNVNYIISAIVCIIAFVFINFVAKTITFSELRSYLGK